MSDREPFTLRVEPQMIPDLRRAFAGAVEEIRPALERLRRNGHIPEAWMGDPVSGLIQDHYNRIVMDEASPHAAFAKLLAYEAELVKVHDALVTMERNYRDAEDANLDLVRGIG